MKIWLLRHGITDWNLERRAQGLEDIELNEGGRKQAAFCGKVLSKVPIHHIAASPLKRAFETAELIAGTHEGLSIEPMQEFIERDFGLLSGKKADEIDSLRKQEEEGKIDLKVEQRKDVFERAFLGLKKLSETYPDGNILVVTHGGIISALLRNLSSEWVPGTFLDNTYLTEITVDGGEFRVTAINVSPEEFAGQWAE